MRTAERSSGGDILLSRVGDAGTETLYEAALSVGEIFSILDPE